MKKFASYFKSVRSISIGLVAVLALAACQTAYNQPPAAVIPTAVPQAIVAPAATATMVPIPVTGSEATINVATDPKLGKILVDGKGMTLYIFTKDTTDTSNCSGNCLKAWPALVTMGNPVVGTGVDSSMIGSTMLADGSKIVTYNHMPLYTFAKDAKAGDTSGQGVGNVWYAVSPDGKAVGMASTGASTGGSSVAASGVTINVATDPKLGKILVDGKGMTLYLFTNDTADKSNCTGNCLKTWPPFLSTGTPVAGAGVNASLIGVATLADGSKIVTYNHMPLYYYGADMKAGDTNGQGVGSVWFAVTPDGKAAGSATSSTSGGGGW